MSFDASVPNAARVYDFFLFKSPLSDFRRAAERAGLPTELHYLGRGDSYRLVLDA